MRRQAWGELLAKMLVEMTDRGPDSAGVAVYGDAVADGCTMFVSLRRRCVSE